MRGELRDGNEGLDLDDHALTINLENITETGQVSLEEGRLVLGREDVGRLPAGAGGTHGLRLVTGADLLLEGRNSLVVLFGGRTSPLNVAVADVQTPVEEERHGQHHGDDDHPAVLSRHNIDHLVTKRLAEQERQGREQHQRVPRLEDKSSDFNHFGDLKNTKQQRKRQGKKKTKLMSVFRAWAPLLSLENS